MDSLDRTWDDVWLLNNCKDLSKTHHAESQQCAPFSPNSYGFPRPSVDPKGVTENLQRDPLRLSSIAGAGPSSALINA